MTYEKTKRGITASELRRLAADKALEVGDARSALDAAADALDARAEPSIRALHNAVDLILLWLAILATYLAIALCATIMIAATALPYKTFMWMFKL